MKKLYKDTFDQITLREEVRQEIKHPEEKKMSTGKYGRPVLRFAGALAAAAVLLISSNAIVYAATGSSLVDIPEFIERVYITVNGKEVDVKDVKTSQDEDGNISYEVEVDEDDTGSVEIRLEDIPKDDSDINIDVLTKEYTIDENEIAGHSDVEKTMAVEQKDGRTYLLVGDGAKQIDITEDFADGKAEGSFRFDKRNYQYAVEGTVEEYTISIKQEEE